MRFDEVCWYVTLSAIGSLWVLVSYLFLEVWDIHMNIMDLLIFLVVLGLVTYIFNMFLAAYIDPKFKVLINIVIGIAVVVYVLHLAGVSVPYFRVKG